MTNKKQFKLYLKNLGLSEKTINSYANCLENMVTDNIKSSIENINSLYDITDVRRLKSLLDSLMNVHAFAEQNSSGNNMYTAAFGTLNIANLYRKSIKIQMETSLRLKEQSMRIMILSIIMMKQQNLLISISQPNKSFSTEPRAQASLTQ